MAVSSSPVDRKLLRRSCLSVSAANHRSTRLSQLAEVAVKWTWKRGRASQQPALDRVGLVCGIVVHDQMHVEFYRYILLDGV